MQSAALFLSFLALAPSDGELFDYQARLVTGNVNFESGRMVAVDQGIAVVGDILGQGLEIESGTATVWTESGGVWSPLATLFADDGKNGDQFGAAVDIDGDRIVVGASHVFDGSFVSGVAYVFERQPGGSWQQVARLVDPAGVAGDRFAQSVAISGDLVLVGASGAGALGRAVSFERNASGAWAFDGYLQLGAGGNFGRHVELDGTTAAISAVNGAGRVALFERQGGAWGLQQVVFDPTPQAGGAFGQALDLDGDRFIAGGPNLNGSEGRIEVFQRAGGTWVQEGTLTQSPATTSEFFAGSAAVQGDLVVISAIDAASPAAPGEFGGVFHLHRFQEGAWSPAGSLDPSEGYGGVFDCGVWIDLSEDHLIAFDRQAIVNPSFVMLFERAILAGLTYRSDPANVDALTTEAPVLGLPWSVDLKLDAQLPHTGFLLVSAGPAEVPTPSGSVLLVDLGPGQLISLIGPWTPQASSLSLVLPADPSLVGFALSMQGLLIEPSGAFDLSNAADLCFGN